MKAIVYDRYGSPDVLQYQEIEKPIPADDQVLIQVRASSANPYDWHFIRGTPSFIRLFTGIRAPKSRRAGADVAGVVEATGRNVTSFKPGDPIFGTAAGSFAEYACAPASSVALKPESLTWEQAASLPIAGVTALQGLRDKGRIRAGQRVLINGAAGGVGTFAVQIAKSYGARVTGVCSTRNIELVRSIGADDLVDYTREDFIHGGRRYDVFFDLVGNNRLSACLGVLEPSGTYIGCGGGAPDRRSIELLGSMLQAAAMAPFVTQKLPGFLAKVNTADLSFLADLIQAGKIAPVLDRSYALKETASAIRYLEQGHARGKVVITVP
jgi:NADPH:quinone reductase-like Zn-dependent oxidoreductase